MKLIGYKKVSKTNEKNETFVFYNLFYTEEIKDYSTKDSVVKSEGLGAGYITVGESKVPDNLVIGSDFEALYNKYGKVAEVVVNEHSN